MTYTCFDLSIENKIAHIVLNRPDKRNSMAKDFWTDLPRAVQEIDAEAKARVIVISSTGPIFSAGIDLEMLGSIGAGADKNNIQSGSEFYSLVAQMQETFSCLENCRIPLIAAVQGGALGAGVDLLTACDIRLASKDSYISVYEIVMGMTADVGTFPRIQNLLPEGIVRELAYTGRRMQAAEMLRLGFVNAVYETSEETLNAAMEMAARIASMAPHAIYGAKRIITYGRDHTTADTLDNIGVWNMAMLNPAEVMEAMQAKQQKRPGRFTDLPPLKKI